MPIDFNLGFNWGPYAKALTVLASGDSWLVPVGVWATEWFGSANTLRLQVWNGAGWVTIATGAAAAEMVSIMSDGSNVRVYNQPPGVNQSFWLFGVVRLQV